MLCKIFFITGKGGVGKTTVASSIALSLPGRTLLVDLKGSAFETLGVKKVVYKPRKVEDNLWLFLLEPKEAAREYVKLKLKILWIILVRSSIYQAFSKVIPALNEAVIIGKIWYEAVSGRWDYIVLDAPPTGQFPGFLKIPKQMKEGVVGPLKSEAEKLISTVERAKNILVTIPEELPVNEAMETIKCVRVDLIVLNKFFEMKENIGNDILPKDKRKIEIALRTLNERSKEYSEILEKTGIPVLKIPLIPDGITRERLEEIAKAIYQSLPG